jgi:predicted dehydrogenase
LDIQRVAFVDSIRLKLCLLILCLDQNDPANIGWVTPTSDMIGNGFCWGQQAHPLAWFYFVCPHLVPTKVFCSMMHSSTTGADVAHSATILCRNNDDDELVVISCSGNTLLPGTSHSEQSVPKKISFQIYGDTATLFYEGDDQHEESGSLELRKADGTIEKPCGHGFLFENCDRDETGPESVQNLIQACLGQDFRVGADSLVGLRTVQTIDAMYKSQQSKQLEDVQFSNVEP